MADLTPKIPDSPESMSGDAMSQCLAETWFNFECGPKFVVYQKWLASHHYIHVVASLIYVVIVFTGQSIMKNRRPLSLKPILFLWNTSLAVFSILGAIRMYQDFRRYHSVGGMRNALCYTIVDPIPGFWTFAFCLSKIAEFGDTIFLVLRKRPVIFLHWYHHVTVLMFTWIACSEASSVGRTFMLMNFIVHSIMYTYYALQSIGIRSPKLISISITSLQIVQMIGGISAILYAKRQIENKLECSPGKLTVPFGLVIYGSYLILFCNFFIQTYLIGRGKKVTATGAAQIDSGKKSYVNNPSSNGAALDHKQKQI